MEQSSSISVFDDENVNILENRDVYVHQYLTAIFQLNLSSNVGQPNGGGHREEKTKIFCLKLLEVSENFLSITNYSRYVFDYLMSPKSEKVEKYIDKRFLHDKFNLFNEQFQVYENDSNKMAYLFNCYCRLEFINDFANLIPTKDQKLLKQYIVDQAALRLVCPYIFNPEGNDDLSSSVADMFTVITCDVLWTSQYLIYAKKFFVDVCNAIFNAKSGSTQCEETVTSSLADLSSEELIIEQVLQNIYQKFYKKFRESLALAPVFLNNIKYVHFLIATPKLAEIFIDLNTPNSIKNGGSKESNSSRPVNSSADIIRNFLLNMPSGSGGGGGGGGGSLQSASGNAMEAHFHETLLGIILCNSPLPSSFSKRVNNMNFNNLNMLFAPMPNFDYQYEFFNSPTTLAPSAIERTEMQIDDQLNKLRQQLTELFFSLLKSSPTVRAQTLKWIESVLVTFNGRAKLWQHELLSIFGNDTLPNVSDGFMLNLSAVLLNLCKPFCSPPPATGYSMADPMSRINNKMLKVDPLFVRHSRTAKKEDCPTQYYPYLLIFRNESVLVNDGTKPPQSGATDHSMDLTSAPEAGEESQYEPNFITRCFFATHRALYLSFRVIHERFTSLNQEVNQIQRRMESLNLTNFSPYMSRDNLTPEQQQALNSLDHNMMITLSMKTALIETNYINLLLDFYISTAAWINNLAVCENEEEAARSFKKLECDGKNFASYFRSKTTSPCLSCVPEFIVENIIDFLLFLRYFEVKPRALTFDIDLTPILTMAILFMGSPHRMRNPHLRAKMAEMLESLLPTVQSNISSLHLEALFTKPCFVEELFPAILNVFVSIEISEDTNNGDVVAFEQKFNYRRPIYVIFKYLCTIPEHQQKLAALADYAEANINSVQSPIFLRFINLLINDAIFLLDEGLSLMAKLRQLQQARDSGQWQAQSDTVRHQNESNYTHLGRLAKFHNFIGRDTITTLANITDYVKSFFSHKILVDRMAAMLNYFLHHLVGPNKTNFKVKQMSEFEFNPGEIVKNICRIYINLACPNPISANSSTLAGSRSSELFNPKFETFCLAIGQDDRSYSDDLLIQANAILKHKLNYSLLAEDILTVDQTVKKVLNMQVNQEIPLEDIPEEFLDPLMSTLMSDPVILPNSRKVVDRATITRHLLSDHTDPYTRTPLTMDMLIPDDELKAKIAQFIHSKQACGAGGEAKPAS